MAFLPTNEGCDDSFVDVVLIFFSSVFAPALGRSLMRAVAVDGYTLDMGRMRDLVILYLVSFVAFFWGDDGPLDSESSMIKNIFYYMEIDCGCVDVGEMMMEK